MIQINLLSWRPLKRQRKKIIFFSIVFVQMCWVFFMAYRFLFFQSSVTAEKSVIPHPSTSSDLSVEKQHFEQDKHWLFQNDAVEDLMLKGILIGKTVKWALISNQKGKIIKAEVGHCIGHPCMCIVRIELDQIVLRGTDQNHRHLIVSV